MDLGNFIDLSKKLASIKRSQTTLKLLLTPLKMNERHCNKYNFR